jgi:hypothetical protein
MAHRQRGSHLYGRALLSVGNIPTKYGMSDTRGSGVMIIRIQKFEKYYHEIPSICSRSGCGLLVGVL